MVYSLLFLTVLAQALSGLAGGFGLMVDPSGQTVGLPAAWLEGSPFRNYFIPGLILFTVLGVFPLVVVWGLWKHRRWAHAGSLLVGLGLVIWILVEICVVGYQAEPPLQAIYGLLGLLIVALASAKSVRATLRH
jgi:hypothetical protein